MPTELDNYGGGTDGRHFDEWFNAFRERTGQTILDDEGIEAHFKGEPYGVMDPDHADWDADVLYPKGSMVRHEGAVYLSLQQTMGTEPGTNDAVWLYQIGGISPEAIAEITAGVEQAGQEKVDLAEEQAEAATTQAGIAASQRALAQTAAGDAATARAAAEAAALTLGATAYATVAALPGSPSAGARGYVYANPDATQNGLWFWSGSAWVRDGLNPVGMTAFEAEQARVDGVAEVTMTAAPDYALASVPWAVGGKVTGAAVDMDGYLYAQLPHAIGRPFLSARYAKVIDADEAGNPVITLHATRGVVESRDRWLALSGFADAHRTEDGHLKIGWTLDGEPRLGPLAPYDWRIEVRDGHVYACAPGLPEIRLTRNSGTIRGASVRGAWVSWLEMVSGIAVLRRVPMSRASLFSSGITSVVHLLSHGQSLSVGSFSTPRATSTAPLAGRAQMFSAGLTATGTPQSGGNEFEAITDADLASLIAAVPGTNEVPIMQAGVQYLAARPVAEGAILSAHGIGGQPYSDLKRGTVPYSNMLAAMVRGAYLCWAAGLQYSAPYLVWNQGQANVAMTQAEYLACLYELQEDFTEDAIAITGQTGERIVVLSQMSSWTPYDVATSGVPLAQAQAAVDEPTRFISSGPEYMHETVDGIHLVPAASANLGARTGRAIAQHQAGTYAGTLRATAAVRTGASVVMAFNRPHGGDDIDLHTGIVSDPGMYGLRWIDNGDGNAVTVSSVTVTGAMQITLTLSDTPTGTGGRIGIADTGTSGADAGPTTGPRSCIRSASADTDALGGAMDYYADHQIITVT